MSDIYEDFITLTPLNCVQKCNYLLSTRPSKPRSCTLFFTLFGLYCGVLVYQAYRSYRRDGLEDKKSEEMSTGAKNVVASSIPAPDVQKPILLQPVDLSTTDLRWRYSYPGTTVGSEGNVDLEKISFLADNEGLAPSTVPSDTSSMAAEAMLTEYLPKQFPLRHN